MKRAIKATVWVIVGCIIVLVVWWSYFEWMLPQYRSNLNNSLTSGKVTLIPTSLSDNAPSSFYFWQAIGYRYGSRLFKFTYQGKAYVSSTVEMGPTLYFSYTKNK
jgi:hypothetical protein